MSLNLSGKSFLVTGAGRGLGRSVAATLHSHGCKVYALSRSPEPLESLVREHPGIIPIKGDIANIEDISEKLKDIEALDGLVNNAATLRTTPVCAIDCTRDFMASIMDVNVYGTINIMQIVARKMIEAGKSGSIVNVSSIWSLQATPQIMAYTISKAALDMVTKQFALELAPHNIRVNSINPTHIVPEVDQPFDKDRESRYASYFQSQTPGRRLCGTSEVVSPIMYLLSDLSTMVSGTVNVVDGAMLSSFSSASTFNDIFNT
ncbi:carbonyl reductase [NADPH] 2-like [Mya arenaria]|uniref:carbonyl reductase [NADPH] 2-like n=1 Tax=Mya arenaria TaxID=6604 RepID=UPI0022E22932|nr:carbonyl reductase [NADPH] 2-like [Mya arenaria]